MASITWAQPKAGGPKIPLDDREARREGPDRWRIETFSGDTPVIEPVNDGWPGEAQIDHRLVCQQPRVI